jgi:hypothetical protein
MANSNGLLDYVKELTGAKNDARLGHILESSVSSISRIRHGKMEIGDTMLIRMHEATGKSVRELKGVLGVPCLPVYVAKLDREVQELPLAIEQNAQAQLPFTAPDEN